MYGNEFADHRNKLIDQIIASGIKEGIVALKSPKVRREPFSNSEHPFYQEALFFWLSGWENPDSAISIDISTKQSVLYTPVYDEEYEIWIGAIPSKEEIIGKCGVDDIKSMKHFNNLVSANSVIFSALSQISNGDNVILPRAASIIRRVKSQNEIKWLREASVATSKGIIEVLKNLKSFKTEKDIETAFYHYASKNGGMGLSFNTISACGQNATHLHYISNKDHLKEGELHLLDCGVFVNHYSGDITRVFPIGGKFSENQKLVYSNLLSLQKELILEARPGETFTSLNEKMLNGIFEILRKLGIVEMNCEFSKPIAQLFCPHGLTHHLGCNTHDLAFYEGYIVEDSLSNSRLLVPGMVITIEPGIYFHQKRLETSNGKEDYKSVNFKRAFEFLSVGGIRIEDDILITDGESIVLSTCPKEIEEIEALINQ